MTPGPWTLTIPAELIERIAERAAELVLERLDGHPGERSRFLTVAEAAEYLRCSRQRIHDLTSAGRLTRHRDGRRVLITRADLDAHLVATAARPVAPPLPRAPQSCTGSGLAT